MDLDLALLIGFTIAGPLSLLASIPFALTVAASPSHYALGKVAGCLASPIVAVVAGSWIGALVYPNWHPWATTALFAGIPLLMFWGVIAVLTHEDFIHAVGKLTAALGRLSYRSIKRLAKLDVFAGSRTPSTKYRVPGKR